MGVVGGLWITMGGGEAGTETTGSCIGTCSKEGRGGAWVRRGGGEIIQGQHGRNCGHGGRTREAGKKEK